MSRFFAQRSPGSKPDLNPMLDVVFILLIFFVVTATFTNESGLDAPRSTPSNAPVNPENPPILIQVNGQNQLTVAGSMVDRRLLRARLEQLKAQRPDVSVVIAPALASETQTLVLVMDTARLAGIRGIQFKDP